MLTEVDTLEGEALAYAAAIASGQKPVPFDDFFMENAANMNANPKRALHVLSFQSLHGKFCIPTQVESRMVGEEIEPISASGMSNLIQNELISVNPTFTCAGWDTDQQAYVDGHWRFISHLLGENNQDENHETIADTAMLAVYRCYVKTKLGSAIELPECYAQTPIRSSMKPA